MQIKTSMRYNYLNYLTLVRMAIINKSTNECWRRCGKKGTLLHNWWECKLENSMDVPQIIKYKTTMWSSNPTPRHQSRENHYSKDTCTPVFTAVLYIIAKKWKQPKCPSTEEWIKKRWYIYIHNGILLSHSKERNNGICSNMDGPRNYHAKWSLPDRHQHHMLSLTCGI